MALVRGEAAGAGGTTSPLSLGPIPARFSYTQASKLLGGRYSCPRSYGYQYRANLPTTSSPALVLGRTIDELGNTFLQRRIGGDTAAGATEAVGTIAEHVWRAAVEDSGLVLSPNDYAAYFAGAMTGLSAYLAFVADVVPVSVQELHEVRISNGDRTIENRGYSDFIEVDGTINDLKVSGVKRWSNGLGAEPAGWDMKWVDSKRDQLVLYWLSRLAQARRIVVGGEDIPMHSPVASRARLIVVNTRKGAKTAEVRALTLGFNDQDRNRVLKWLRAADDIKASGVYPARPGDACSFCSFTERCRGDFAAGNDPFTGCAS